MSNLTIEAVPDELVALTATPEGMARATVLAAFPEMALDDFCKREKDAWHSRQEKLSSMARESLELHGPDKAVTGGRE
ncbi:hypothetical protein [Armatimonas sp.]|uniref:hypothetical protein n=1 Tax=Armatimonas sp. TaxID=1872638 RepID=UPI0037504842